MKYVKFSSESEVLDHMDRLQAHHTEVQDPTQPRWIDTVIPAPGGGYATTLTDDDVAEIEANTTPATMKNGQIIEPAHIFAGFLEGNSWADFGDGELVDDLALPVEEEPII